MAWRLYGLGGASLESLWIQIIPLPTRAQAEALAATLLGRGRPNPDAKTVAISEPQPLQRIEMSGVGIVNATEHAFRRQGNTGRELRLVGAVDDVVFGMAYASFGEGWSQERFVGVSQLQADKIHRQSAAS